jgi:hypothetical protein
MKRHQADVFVVLALFCVYATCALLLCAIGAGIYRDASNVMQQNYDQRTSSLYIAEKVRQSDTNGAVEVRQLDGNDALVLIEQESGEFYEIWIYVHEGMLCETFIPAGSEVNYQLGQEIMPVQAMHLVQSPLNAETSPGADAGVNTGADTDTDAGTGTGMDASTDTGTNASMDRISRVTSTGSLLEVNFTLADGSSSGIDLYLRSGAGER